MANEETVIERFERQYLDCLKQEKYLPQFTCGKAYVVQLTCVSCESLTRQKL